MAGADEVNTASKQVVRKIGEAEGELIGNKITVEPQENLHINVDIKKSSTC